MLINYLRTAARSLSKRSLYSIINSIGLTIGFTSVLLITLYVAHEYSYDSFHSKNDNIYRAKGSFRYGDQDIQTNSMSVAFGPRVAEISDQIENYCRYFKNDQVAIHNESGNKFMEGNFMFADPQLFEMFDFELLQGNRTDLENPGKVFITESIAEKYFGTSDPIGKVLTYDREIDLIVAGILVESPSNSSIRFDFVTSLETLNLLPDMEYQMKNEKIQLGMFQTFFLLKDFADTELIIEGIKEFDDVDETQSYTFEPLADLHFEGVNSDESLKRNLLIFSSIGILILFLALINYVNLTTVNNTQRSKEIAVRKVIGANVWNISSLFLAETILVVIGSATAAMVLVYMVLPDFSNYLGAPISPDFLLHPYFLITGSSILLISILVTSVYPIYALLNFNLVNLLKGKVIDRNNKNIVQKVFTSFQFAITIGLLLCTFVIIKQIQHIKNLDLGLDREQTLVVKLGESNGSGFLDAKTKLDQLSSVEKSGLATNSVYKGYAMYFTKIPGTEEDLTLIFMNMDRNVVDILGLEIIENTDERTMEGNVLINEAARDRLNLQENLFKEEIALGRSATHINGVVKDFSYANPENEIQPVSISIISDTTRNTHKYGAELYIKLSKNALVGQTLSQIRGVLDEYQPDFPFEYYFLDDAFDKYFEKEARLATLLKIFSGVGISLAILGLYGLVSFTLNKRFKELGIRKVLGAGETGLIGLICKDYLWILIISTVIAIPVSLLSIEAWMDNFTNKITIGWTLPTYAIVSIASIAALTIIIKTIQVLSLNPVDALKEE